MVTEPETVAPATGAVRIMVGEVVSGAGGMAKEQEAVVPPFDPVQFQR
jgi:hypothetical protein